MPRAKDGLGIGRAILIGLGIDQVYSVRTKRATTSGSPIYVSLCESTVV